MILNFFAALMFSCLTSKAIDIEHHHDPTSQNRNEINLNKNSAQSITDTINGVESKKAEKRYRHAIEQLNERQRAIDAKDKKIRQIEAENAALQQKINELRTDNDLSEQIQRVEKRAAEADAERRKVINLSEIPDISESEFDYAFQSPQGQVRSELVFLYSNFLKIDPYYKNRKRAKEFGLTAVKYADQAEASAQHEEGLLYKEIALEFLDLAIGLHPVTGFAQSTYELIYGSRLLTGAQLTGFDRSLAFLNIVTLGTGKLLFKLGKAADLAGKAMSRLSHLGSDIKAIENAILTGQTICQKAAKLGIPAADLKRVVNDAHHIFGPKAISKHNLGGLLEKFSRDQIHAFSSLEKAIQNLADQKKLGSGIFETTVVVKDTVVTVTGRMVDGVARIGTAFIP
jgi:hypothetical protein